MQLDPIASAIRSSAETVRISLAESVLSVASLLPKAIMAVVLVAVGLAVAPVCVWAVEYVITGLGLDALADRVGFTKVLRFFGDQLSFSKVVGIITYSAVLAGFILASLRVLEFTSAIEFVSALLAFTPRVIVALFSLIIGYVSAYGAVWIVRRLVTVTRIPIENPSSLSLIVRGGCVTLGVFGALSAIGVSDTFIQTLFIATAGAVALAFGLGGKEKATGVIERASEKVDSKK
jgi:hypothetical protein